ncbi:MAG: minor capsid protein [Archaeoglobus sp.]|uniref:phage head morphogenesis protein n=1 Tax=Archaeoglobus sp. TaxID=1872626 RepID=UPI001D38D145|nr:phage minor head protein [Archaeoglobus sp.]MBO8180272.1 minor capsid protein [Archaeoglobus sp.]
MVREEELDYILQQIELAIDDAFDKAYEGSEEYIRRAYEKGNELGNKDLKSVGINFDIPPDIHALDFLDGYQFDLIKGVSEDLKKEIKRVVRDGIINGKSMREVANDLKQVFNTRKWRLNTIARTEVIRASNFGRYEAWKKSGVVVGKEWVTAFDDRTCPECAAMDGDQASLEKPFRNGVLMPPAHPNCRCTAIPIIDRSLAGLKKGKYDDEKKYIKPKRKELRVKSIEAAYAKHLLSTFKEAFKEIIAIWERYGRLLS